MTERCTRSFLQQIAKYSHGKKGEKPWQNPLIQQMIVAEYANIYFDVKSGIGVSLYSYRRFRRLQMTAPPY